MNIKKYQFKKKSLFYLPRKKSNLILQRSHKGVLIFSIQFTVIVHSKNFELKTLNIEIKNG
jgi:hypothetical protein